MTAFETRDEQGRLHSFDDQPAHVQPGGQERWYRHDKLTSTPTAARSGTATLLADVQRVWPAAAGPALAAAATPVVLARSL